MKLSTIKSVMVGALLGVAGMIMNTQQTQAASCCLILPPFPSNQITAFVTDYYPTQDSALSLFTFFVTNGGAIPAGTYEGWCIDAQTFIDPRQGGSLLGTTYTGSLLSTCDPLELALVPARPDSPPVGPPPIVSLDTWHELNYIINHKNGAYMWNVQAAINAIIGGPVPGPSPPYPPLDTNVVAAILADAQSNASNWVSQCGDKVAAVFVISNTTPLQLLILEVPCCNLVFTKVPGDTNLGCNPSNIPDCTGGPVDTNIVNATSCCGAVTITCSKSDSTIDCKNIRIITYTATDTTGNTISTTQTITWTTNSTGPTLTVTATGGNLPCNATPPGDSDIKATVTVTDNCATVTTNVSHVDSGTPCAMRRTFTITAVDACGKQAPAQTVIYTWTSDTNAPTVSGLPTGGDLGCNPKKIPGNSDITVTVMDNCSVARTNISFVDSGTPCAMTRTFMVTATDGCGNTSAPKTVVYTWKIDTNAPVITNVPPGGNLGCISNNLPTDVSVKALVGATDNCGSLTINVSHSDVISNCITTRTFKISATDGCNNTSATNTVVYTFGCPCNTNPPLAHCDTATIGFWHNRNGQGLINAQTPDGALATYLASNFPYLYGANAPAGDNLTGKKNADVAALFITFFSVTGPKIDAQIMAGALAVYVTTDGLGGGTGSSNGFCDSVGGTGSHTYNVGTNGHIVGLQDNTSYTVFDLLKQANILRKAGLYTPTVALAFNDIFNGINQGGDI